MSKPRHIRPVGSGQDPLKMMVFGGPGAGKTRFFGTAPNNLILRPPSDHTTSIHKPHSCEEWVLHDWNDFGEALDYLRHEGRKEHEWVTLDSVSLFQDYGLDHVWADTIARRPDRAALHAGLDKGEYGRNMVRLAQNIRDLVGIGGFNVGITAHAFESTDEDGNPMWKPWIQGNMMSDKIAGYMNVVGYLRERASKDGAAPYRELVFKKVRRNGIKLEVKDQTDALGGFMRDPTIPKVMAAIAAKNGTNIVPARTRRPVRRTTGRNQ